MSDLRITGACLDCDAWLSGTSALAWAGEHIDMYPDHRLMLTRFGDLPRTLDTRP